MKLIPTTKDKFALVDDKDYEQLMNYCWQYSLPGGYAKTAITIDGKQKTLRMHQMIIGKNLGKEIDHINGNKLDNRRKNLRTCTHSENVRNVPKRKDSSLKYKGIERTRDRFRARIQIDGNRVYSKSFETQEEAFDKYKDLAKQYHKDFARIY